MSTNSANKRIAKNTLVLYARSAITMLVALYTSRVVLQSLGVLDFGIYNIIAGMVGMFSVFTGTISNAVSRFFAFALGKKDKEGVTRTYTVSGNILLLTVCIIILLGETIGLYFLNRHLTIPSSRMVAANWVYQAVVVSFVVNALNIPNTAAIIAYEKMTFYAYLSIADAVSKLAITVSLQFSDWDKLQLYASLLSVQQIAIFICYNIYVKKNFKNCRYRFCLFKDDFLKLFSYIGWTFVSSLSFIAKNQGVDVLLNMFFGPLVNAAKGIAAQVYNATSTLGVNFLTAVSPQITKSYAEGDVVFMRNLVFRSVRLSFFLLAILMMPIALNVENILRIWLGVVPGYAPQFVNLMLLVCLFDTCSLPFHYGIVATGEIKAYQIFSSLIQLCNLPLSYLALYFGAQPYVVIVVAIVFSLTLFAFRLVWGRNVLEFSLRNFVKAVLGRILITGACIMLVDWFLLARSADVLVFLVSAVLVTLLNTLLIYILGLDAAEKVMINTKIISYGNKIFKCNK